MSSLEKNDGHNDILQYKSMTSGTCSDAHTGDCTTELRFELRDITVQTVEGAMVIPAFVAIGAPFAFHLARDKQHYQVSDFIKRQTLTIELDTYQQCEQAIALFCQAAQSEAAV